MYFQQLSPLGEKVRNALTIDVEDYFQATAFESVVDRKDWAVYPSRVENNTRRVMDMLDVHGLKGTFFVLGWVAERFPLMVRDMADNGHEVACHGFGHELVYNMTPESFRADVRLAKNTLENITGRKVLGYRAPSYSIVDRSMWALDVLIEEGFVYDSSIFPFISCNCKNGDNRFVHVVKRYAGSIYEFPPSTFRMIMPGNKILFPVSSKGYIRMLPLTFMRWKMRDINQVENQPAILAFRSWELDPDQPRIKSSIRNRFFHYVNLELAEEKIIHLFQKFKFDPVINLLDNNTY